MSDYDNGFARAQASYENMSDDWGYDEDEDHELYPMDPSEEEGPTPEEAIEAYKRIKQKEF